MIAPPANPAAKRQTKNQRNDSGAAHAKNVAAARIIIARSRIASAMRAAIGRASNAPAR